MDYGHLSRLTLTILEPRDECHFMTLFEEYLLKEDLKFELASAKNTATAT